MVGSLGRTEHCETLLLSGPGTAPPAARADERSFASSSPRFPGAVRNGDCSHNAGQIKQRRKKTSEKILFFFFNFV